MDKVSVARRFLFLVWTSRTTKNFNCLFLIMASSSPLASPHETTFWLERWERERVGCLHTLFPLAGFNGGFLLKSRKTNYRHACKNKRKGRPDRLLQLQSSSFSLLFSLFFWWERSTEVWMRIEKERKKERLANSRINNKQKTTSLRFWRALSVYFCFLLQNPIKIYSFFTHHLFTLQISNFKK